MRPSDLLLPFARKDEAVREALAAHNPFK